MTDVQTVAVPTLSERISRLPIKNATFKSVLRYGAKKLANAEELNKFFDADFDSFQKSVPAVFRSVKKIESVLGVLTGANSFLPDVDATREALSVICEELVNDEIASLTKWLSSYKLDDQQQAIAVEQLKIARRSMMSAVRASEVFKGVYGVK